MNTQRITLSQQRHSMTQLNDRLRSHYSRSQAYSSEEQPAPNEENVDFAKVEEEFRNE